MGWARNGYWILSQKYFYYQLILTYDSINVIVLINSSKRLGKCTYISFYCYLTLVASTFKIISSQGRIWKRNTMKIIVK